MATLEFTAPVAQASPLKNEDANQLCTVRLLAATNVSPPTQAGEYDNLVFSLSGPSSSTATLQPGADALEKDVTIDVPGRYLIRLTARGHDGNDFTTENFSALVEVQDSQVPPHPDHPTASGSIPAPNETNEFDPNDGWARSSEAYLSLVSKRAGYKNIVSVTGSFPIAKGQVIKLDASDALQQWKSSSLTVSDSYNNYTLVTAGLAQDAVLTLPSDTLAFLLEDLAAGGKALALVTGVINFDTSLMGAGDTIYVDAVAGGITHNNAALVTSRKVGKVLKSGADAVLNPGCIYFNGEAPLLESVFDFAAVGGLNGQVQFNDNGDLEGSTLNYDSGNTPTTFGLNTAAVANVLLTTQVALNENSVCAVFDQQDSNNTVSAVSITSASPGTALVVTGSGTGDLVNVIDGAAEVFTILDGGNVGVNTVAPNATLDVQGSMAHTVSLVDNASTPYTITATDYTIACDSTASVIRVNLPTATSSLIGRTLRVGDHVGQAAVNAIEIRTAAADTVNGALGGLDITVNFGWVTIQCITATAWVVVATA